MGGGEQRNGVDLLLVCSTGGHLLQLYSLEQVWARFTRAWVTLSNSDSRSLLSSEQVVFAHAPTERNLGNLLRNFRLAWRTLGEVRPRVVISTGAAVAIPFAWCARAKRIPVVYIESFARIDRLSVTGRLVAPVADHFFVQWPELAARTPRARYVGNVFSSAP